MEKLDLLHFHNFKELPLELFDRAGYSIYVLDKKWTYLFVNNFVKKNLEADPKG